MVERVSVDSETGEVLDEGTEATISIGGGPEMPLQVMEDNSPREVEEKGAGDE